MCYIVFVSHGFHWRSIKVASFDYVIKVVLVIFQQYNYLKIEGGLHHFRTAYVLV